jgi:hypothetical protein
MRGWYISLELVTVGERNRCWLLFFDFGCGTDRTLN